MCKKRVLIVDDEKELVKMLSLNLKNHGYETLFAYDGLVALDIVKTELPDLILLDVMMPGMDGKEVCSILKQDLNTRAIPIIMVSAKDQLQDKLDGLSFGADDYITKPFNIKELIMRIEAALRQVEVLATHCTVYQIGNLKLDTTTFQVYVENHKLDCTLTEFRILQLLMSRKNLVKKDELAKLIFEKDLGEVGRVLDVHMRNLRKKLKGSCSCDIKTIRGIGYVIEE